MYLDRGMTDKQRLHQLVESLPDDEVESVIAYVERLEARIHDPLREALDAAPIDDEPDDDDFDGGLTEARRETLSHDEVRRRFLG
jgi:hypothetical protein